MIKMASLFHQLQAHLLRLIHRQWKVDKRMLTISQLTGGLPGHPTTVLGLFPPILPLAWNFGRAENLEVRVDKEKCHDLAMSRFGRVLKTETLHAMLNDIRESDQTSLAGDHASRILDPRVLVLEPKDIPQPSMVVLLVGYANLFGINKMSERKSGFRDIIV